MFEEAKDFGNPTPIEETKKEDEGNIQKKKLQNLAAVAAKLLLPEGIREIVLKKTGE